jgi:predicted acetyltransferase
MEFAFREPGPLSDGVIDLALEEKDTGDPARGLVPCYHFKISPHGSGTKVGEIRLRVGSVITNPGLLTAGHIGFEVGEAYRGHGYAGRACALLEPLALAHGLRHVVLTCDPANVASRRTCEQLGAALVGIYVVPPDHPMYLKGRREVCRYLWILAADPKRAPPPG